MQPSSEELTTIILSEAIEQANRFSVQLTSDLRILNERYVNKDELDQEALSSATKLYTELHNILNVVFRDGNFSSETAHQFLTVVRSLSKQFSPPGIDYEEAEKRFRELFIQYLDKKRVIIPG